MIYNFKDDDPTYPHNNYNVDLKVLDSRIENLVQIIKNKKTKISNLQELILEENSKLNDVLNDLHYLQNIRLERKNQ